MLIAQISDCHVTTERSRPDGTPSRQESLRAAVSHLAGWARQPDVVLVTGDLTDHGTADEYDAFQTLIAPLPMPVHVIPGNHDDRQRMLERWPAQGRHALPGFMQYVVEDHPVRLLALDTVRPGSDAGELCARRLDWLDARLAEAPSRPALVFMHHPPFLTGLTVLDALGLDGREAFAAVLARHPQVERVVAGHIHLEMQRRLSGTLAMTASSTGLQIHAGLDEPSQLRATPYRPSGLVHAWDAHSGMRSFSSPIGETGPYPLIHDGRDWVR